MVCFQLPLENLAIEGKNYSTEGGGGMANTTTTPASPKLTASVVLPPSLFDSIADNSNLTDVGIFFSIYKTASFFPLANVSNSTIVAPLVVGVTVVPGIAYNLTDPIVLIFTIPNKVGTLIIMLHNMMVTYNRTIQNMSV